MTDRERSPRQDESQTWEEVRASLKQLLAEAEKPDLVLEEALAKLKKLARKHGIETDAPRPES